MDDCIEWTGARNHKRGGYGTLRVNGKHQYAHRVAWEKANGRRVPPGMLVLHECDNPPCVNPNHLRIGTHRDNTCDMVRKGRAPKHFFGPGHPRCKLTTAQVEEIRKTRGSGVSQRALAKVYGVDHSTIGIIQRGDGRRSG